MVPNQYTPEWFLGAAGAVQASLVAQYSADLSVSLHASNWA